MLSNSGADDDEVLIFLLDFGISLLVDRANVFPMPVRFKDDLPFQAVECFFSDLEPCRTGVALGDRPPSSEEVSERWEVPVAEETLDGKDETMIKSQTRTAKLHGTSVDPGDSSDDDDDIIGADIDTTAVGRSETPVTIETECTTEGAHETTHTCSEGDADRPTFGPSSPVALLTEVEPPTWDPNIASYIMDITGNISSSHLLTAMVSLFSLPSLSLYCIVLSLYCHCIVLSLYLWSSFVLQYFCFD